MAKTESKKNKTALGDIYKQELNSESFKPQIVKFPTWFLLFNLLVAILAGWLGGYLGQRYLPTQNQTSLATTSSSLLQNNKPVEVSLLEQRRFEQDLSKLDILRERVVGIFNKKTASEAPIANVYTNKDLVGHGVSVSSDGWILTTLEAVTPENLVVVTFDKKVLAITKAERDLLTGAWFIKVNGNGFKVAGLADVSHLPLTQAVAIAKFLVAPYSLEVSQDNLNSLWYGKASVSADFLRSTEKIDYYLKLSNTQSSGLVFNNNSEFVGVAKNGLVIPASYLQTAISSLASNNGKIVRPLLGVNYVSLSETFGLPNKFTENRSSGALLIGDASQKVLAVVDKSPAQVAGLKAGDVVTKVNNEEINEANSFTKLIQDYPVNTQIELTFWRDAKEQKVKFILGKISQ